MDPTADRPKWRSAIAAGLYYSGVIRISERLSRQYEFAPRRRIGLAARDARPKFAILCYHRIGTQGIPLFSGLPPQIFERQMRFLRKHYQVVSLDEMCNQMAQPANAGNFVAVTFDDGYRDLYEHALPVLKRFSIPATVFLPVACIESAQVPWYDKIFLALKVFKGEELAVSLDQRRTFQLDSYKARIQAAAQINGFLRTVPNATRQDFCERFEKGIPLPAEELRGRMLSWEQVRTMSREGVSFGSHTMTHPAVSRLSNAELDRELGDSKAILEKRLQAPAPHFAFPFGKSNDCGTAARPVLARCAYRSAATTVEGINMPGDDPYELRRVQFGEERSLAMFALRLGRLFLSPGVCHPTSSPTVAPPDFGASRTANEQWAE